VDGLFSEQEDVVAWLCSTHGAYWGVAESEGNPHCHYRLVCDFTESKLRRTFRDHCPDRRGNGCWSLSRCDDPDRYDQYMAKGEGPDKPPRLVCCHGLDVPIGIDELHDAYWAENKELNKARRKKLVGNCTEQLLEICMSKDITHWDSICQEYIRLCIAANKGINTFSARSVCNTVWVKVQKDREQAIVDLAKLITPPFL